MRRKSVRLLVWLLLAVAFVGSIAMAAYGFRGGAAGPVQFVEPPPWNGVQVTWKWSTLNATQDLLWKSGCLFGAYDHAGNFYRPYLGHNQQLGHLWGEIAETPVAPRNRRVNTEGPPAGPPNGVMRPPVQNDTGEVAPKKKAEADLPTGVESGLISRVDRFSYCGKECAKEDIYQLIGGKVDQGKLTDDSRKDVISVQCADKAKRAEFMKQFASDPRYAKLRERANAWEAEPTDWSLDAGFVKAEGTVTVQDADGVVLARCQVQDVANPEQVIGEIRKADPNYDQKKDPTPANPADGGLNIDLSQVKGPHLAIGAALAAAGYFAWRGKPTKKA